MCSTECLPMCSILLFAVIVYNKMIGNIGHRSCDAVNVGHSKLSLFFPNDQIAIMNILLRITAENNKRKANDQ